MSLLSGKGMKKNLININTFDRQSNDIKFSQ
jgi:hypothetical protein